MEDEIAQHRAHSLAICQNFLLELRRFQEDANIFFGGEIHKAYVAATEQAIHQVSKIQNRIRSL